MNCQACGTALASTARYCYKCGAQVGSAPAAGWRVGLPWGVAGAALGALIAVLALRLSSGGNRADQAGDLGAQSPFAGTGDGGGGGRGGGGGAATTDISQMSPEERATRLYNRVMSLHAAGKQDSAAFFLPMALQAYAMLPALDADARYHVGVLDLAGGDAAGALAQADSIRRLVPSHLFGFMLRARALEVRRDVQGAQQAYGDFLRNETAERARNRPEYADHAQNLDAFHEQATQATTEKSKSGG